MWFFLAYVAGWVIFTGIGTYYFSNSPNWQSSSDPPAPLMAAITSIVWPVFLVFLLVKWWERPSEMIRCPRCKKKNPAKADYCCRCGIRFSDKE